MNASMDSSPTELYLPLSLSYPIKVVSLDAPSQSDVERGTRLLSYSCVYLPTTPDPKPETRFGTWDSAIQGTLKSWRIKPGDIISEKKARNTPAVVLIEPCKHGMQLGGLCVLCGKDMTKYVKPCLINKFPLSNDFTFLYVPQKCRLYGFLRCLACVYPDDPFSLWPHCLPRGSSAH